MLKQHCRFPWRSTRNKRSPPSRDHQDEAATQHEHSKKAEMDTFIEEHFDLLEIRPDQTPTWKKAEHRYASLARAAGLSSTSLDNLQTYDPLSSQGPPPLPEKLRINTTIASHTVSCHSDLSSAEDSNLLTALAWLQPNYHRGDHVRSVSITPTIESVSNTFAQARHVRPIQQ